MLRISSKSLFVVYEVPLVDSIYVAPGVSFNFDFDFYSVSLLDFISLEFA